MATLYHLHPEMGTELIARFEAIGDQRASSLRLGLNRNPNYDLDFALGLVLEAERLHSAKQGGAKVITDDQHARTQEAYYEKFALWSGIHRNWPVVLIKPHEMGAWMNYYLGEISVCNQAGFYLHEVLSTYNFETVPEWLRKRVTHFTLFCEVSMAMLCKYRWYRMTMSRFHKPDRLKQHEDEFWQAVNQAHPTNA